MDKELGERLDRIDAQLAGVIGIVATIIDVVPPSVHELLISRLHEQFEGMSAALLAHSGPHSDAAIFGLEALRKALRLDEK